MVSPVVITQTALAVTTGGVSVVAISGPLVAGLIQNPNNPHDQGLSFVEPLFVSILGPADLSETATTVELQPGQSFTVPPGLTGNVWVNAATSGHKFSGIAVFPQTPFVPSSNTFPPGGPVTLTAAIKAYLYQQYADDDDLQAWFLAYNDLAQGLVDWFNDINLPIYSGLTGTTLDWVATGLYGMSRPTLPSGRSHSIGAINTWALNTIPLNYFRVIGSSTFFVCTDDLFQRILTWQLYKEDGKYIGIRWLKRRLMRFLLGTNGIGYNVDQTYLVSVTIAGSVCTITLDGSLTNAPFLKAAILSGAVELPFQLTYTVNIT